LLLLPLLLLLQSQPLLSPAAALLDVPSSALRQVRSRLCSTPWQQLRVLWNAAAANRATRVLYRRCS
jgi:hypothetical protein